MSNNTIFLFENRLQIYILENEIKFETLITSHLIHWFPLEVKKCNQDENIPNFICAFGESDDL